MTDPKRPANESEAITWLVEQVPELRPLLQQHVAENGELLSYVVFESDFLRWFVERIRRGDHEPARRFVEAMEPLMTTNVKPPANDRVWNLAGVCFVEGLVMSGDDDVLEIARPWMEPNTWGERPAHVLVSQWQAAAHHLTTGTARQGRPAAVESTLSATATARRESPPTRPPRGGSCGRSTTT